MNRNVDRILYTLVGIGGGQDGKDASDKGGNIVLVSFDKAVLEKRKGEDSRFKIERQIVDDGDLKAAYAKLDAVERFLIESDIAAKNTILPR